MTQNLGNLFIDGEGTINDGSGNYSITSTGGVSISTTEKQSGTGSIAFNGVDGYLTVPGTENFDIGHGDFTIDFWMKAPSNTNPRVILIQSADDVAHAPDDFYLYIKNHSIIISTLGTAEWPTTTQVVDDNIWHHIAYTRAGSTLRLFIDGVLENSVEVTDWASINAAIRVGFGANVSYYDGYLDNFRIILGTALWGTDFEVDNDDSMKYLADPNTIKNLSGVYKVNENIRGRAEAGCIRPTVKEIYKGGFEFNCSPRQRVLPLPETTGFLDPTVFTSGDASSEASMFNSTNILVSGKWYIEMEFTVLSSTRAAKAFFLINNADSGSVVSGDLGGASTDPSFSFIAVQGDIVGIAVDVDAGTVDVYKSGEFIESKSWTPAIPLKLSRYVATNTVLADITATVKIGDDIAYLPAEYSAFRVIE